jgi:hypothetical protein
MVAKSLGGNASAVQTGAAHFFGFGNNYLQTILGRIFGCPISAGTCPYDD